MLLIKGTQIKVTRSDIFSLRVDSIVSPSDIELSMEKGLSASIRSKGGKKIENEAKRFAPLSMGDAVATGSGRLPSKFIIHSVVLSGDSNPTEDKIRLACRNVFRVAEGLRIRSIALPALVTGSLSYKACAKIMSQEVFRHLNENTSKIKEIIFCLDNDEAFEAFSKNAIGYLDYITNKLKSPFLTVDAIIEVEGGIVFIERSNPPFGWALPGGFVDYGESLEEAVIREAKEETNLSLTELLQFHTYSDPERDPRFHTVGTVFIAKGMGTPRAGDDAQGIRIAGIDEINGMEFAFDHKKIIQEYFALKK